MKKEIAKQIKDALIELAIKDKLPLDLNQLDINIFEKILAPIEKVIKAKNRVLKTVRKDAEMALNGKWAIAENATEECKKGFGCQIELIDKVVNKDF